MPKFFALMLSLLGVFALGIAWFQWRRGEASRSWTRTPGRIVTSRVEEVQGPSEEGYPKYRSMIGYEFSANGRSYQGAETAVGSSAASTSSDATWARRETERFPVGREVTVHYDPADPRRAVLEPGVPQLLPLVAVGMVLLVAGLYVLSR